MFHEAFEWWMAVMLHIKGSFDVYANVHLLVVELLSLPQKVARLKVGSH